MIAFDLAAARTELADIDLGDGAAGGALAERLLAEVERLRIVLCEIADYAEERRHAIADGQGLAQHALAAIVNTARQSVAR